MVRAACRGTKDPDDFFPKRNESARANAAKMVCFTCPVIFACREYRDRTKSTYGIWGGEYVPRE